jgi:hypothetical protein
MESLSALRLARLEMVQALECLDRAIAAATDGSGQELGQAALSWDGPLDAEGLATARKLGPASVTAFVLEARRTYAALGKGSVPLRQWNMERFGVKSLDHVLCREGR